MDRKDKKKKRMSLCGSALEQGYQWHSLHFNISPSILSHRKLSKRRIVVLTKNDASDRPDTNTFVVDVETNRSSCCLFICYSSSLIDFLTSTLLHQVSSNPYHFSLPSSRSRCSLRLVTKFLFSFVLPCYLCWYWMHMSYEMVKKKITLDHIDEMYFYNG